MKKLTRKEQKQILRAAAMIENEKITSSCYALRETGFNRERYANFYEKSASQEWWPTYDYSYKHERIICLLWFLEVNS